MRADRLLSTLMLLQTRGQLTARQLAAELEVSERTIYRDIDALSCAGVPIYADHGPGGGFALLDSYRTNLTGLNRDEVRALFMLSIPAPLSELGVSQELKAALLKLSAALSATGRKYEEHVRQRVHLDWAGWFQQDEPVPYLQTIQKAVWQDRVLHITYPLPFGTEVVLPVHPYGLIAKAGAWYLVCARDGHIYVYRISRVLNARLSEERFQRREGFDLKVFWTEYCAARENNRPYYAVTLRAAPELIPLLEHRFGEQIHNTSNATRPLDETGWVTLTLPFETFADARDHILGLGRSVEVLEPIPLRESIIDFAEQIVALYKERERDSE